MGVQRLKKQGDFIERELYEIIVNSKGKPDRLAISLYSYLKSWFQPNKNNGFKKSGKFDIRKHGFRTSYEELAKIHFCTKEAIRQKIVLLEQLGLLSRNFRIECDGGIRKNNILHILLWKETPYFEFEFGLEKRQLFKSSINKETWKEIAKNETGGSPKILGEGLQKNLDSSPKNKGGGLQVELDIIYSNTTPYNTDLSDLCSSEDMSLGIENQNLKNQDTIVTKQAEQMDIHTKNGNIYNNNRLLNEFDFTNDLIDAIRQKSDKPHFSNDRIKAIMRNIVASNPKVRIWGGRNAFINYMVKAVNNEKEFTKEEKSQSLAEMKRREAEKLLWQFENKIITYF